MVMSYSADNDINGIYYGRGMEEHTSTTLLHPSPVLAIIFSEIVIT